MDGTSNNEEIQHPVRDRNEGGGGGGSGMEEEDLVRWLLLVALSHTTYSNPHQGVNISRWALV